jgi:hypothetical protein
MRELDAPNYGFTSFDNIFTAMLLMIQTTTISDWSRYMYGIAGSKPLVFVGFFFIVLILVAAYLTLNFVIAIIYTVYQEHHLQFAQGLSAVGYRVGIGGPLASIMARGGRHRGQFSQPAAVVLFLRDLFWFQISPEAQRHLSFAEKKESLQQSVKQSRRDARSATEMLLALYSHGRTGDAVGSSNTAFDGHQDVPLKGLKPFTSTLHFCLLVTFG